LFLFSEVSNELGVGFVEKGYLVGVFLVELFDLLAMHFQEYLGIKKFLFYYPVTLSQIFEDEWMDGRRFRLFVVKVFGFGLSEERLELLFSECLIREFKEKITFILS
jgi:hypothetical protein